ncbi:hypothetical protein SUGI_0947320 [Cryptomeria japonica]|uniref:uncharacterized protein LOC131066907 n=1 Tax=Cryptomeria japonica TaxID=3369 RepID=UPI002414BD8D|nr:uncharacterized protein LOC131066907 [Cryptomeria japonica]GLJ45005.1 hypothetical protein SUGI_0947320 [Cryptomeria japonica]
MASKMASTVFFLVYTLLISTSFCHGRQEKPSAVVVRGTVFCDTCSQNRLSDSSYFISGARVAVECTLNRRSRSSIRVEGESDEKGEFRIDVPSEFLSKCRVELISRPDDSECNVPSISTPSKITLISAEEGVRTYSAGYLSYRPENVPTACMMEDTLNLFVRGREMAETPKTSKDTVSPPSLPTIPTIPTTFPPLPLAPPLPGVPPFPRAPPLPGFPPLPLAPPFGGFPPLPQVPSISIPSLPSFGFPPLSPFAFSFPPIPFLTPPSPSK